MGELVSKEAPAFAMGHFLMPLCVCTCGTHNRPAGAHTPPSVGPSDKEASKPSSKQVVMLLWQGLQTTEEWPGANAPGLQG